MSQIDESQNRDPIKASESLPFLAKPELIIGLVGPIGVDLEHVTNCLNAALTDVDYVPAVFRITELMQEIDVQCPLGASGYIDSIRQRIRYANAVREKLHRNDALAVLAVSAIRQFRAETSGDEEEPLSGRAYVLRQFKRPEEIKLFRSIYGRQFIQVSVHAPQEQRIRRIFKKEIQSNRAIEQKFISENNARAIVKQDEIEDEEFGQDVRDAFPLGDVFINAVNKKECEETIRRFVKALFGDNSASPTHDEYGMYLAKSASLRTSALTRQVGAAIFRDSGEIASLGSNEVPKAGGGTYWTGDESDARDFVEGADPNDQKKRELLVDLAKRLADGGFLSAELKAIGDPIQIADRVLRTKGPSNIAESKLMDILEFGRDIHAEMSAITDAARKGIPIAGATLYSTTFPCHLCAKHIIASGIKRVVYLEPYPKSYAEELHADAIEIDGSGSSKKVGFQRFIGISPFRYRDLFEKGKRKYSSGVAQQWHKGTMQPMVEVLYPSYFKAEAFAVQSLKSAIIPTEPIAKASNDP
jgi:cytidine deaminase